jgi:hypothetical protein
MGKETADIQQRIATGPIRVRSRGQRFRNPKDLLVAVLAHAGGEWKTATGREMSKEDRGHFADEQLPALEDRAREVSARLADALAGVGRFVTACREELGPMAAAQVAAYLAQRDEDKAEAPRRKERLAVEAWAARKNHIPQPLAMARILNGWVIGAELTEDEYDAAGALRLSGGHQLMKLLRFTTDRLPFLVEGPFAGKTGESTVVNLLRPEDASNWSVGIRGRVVALLGSDRPGRHGEPVWEDFGFSKRPTARMMAYASLLLGSRPQINEKSRVSKGGKVAPGLDKGLTLWDFIDLEEAAIRAVRSRLLRSRTPAR